MSKKSDPSRKETFYFRGGLYAFLFCILFSFFFFAWVIQQGRKMDFNEVEVSEGGDLSGQGEEGGIGGDLSGKRKKGEKEDMEDLKMDSSKPLWVSQKFLVSKGSKVYQVNCSVCHGVSGKGDGVASQGLNPPPQDLVKGKWEYGGDSIGLFQSISDGIKGTSMVAFKHLSKEDRWALVHFIRSITQNKVKDDPKKLEDFGKKAQ